MGANRLNENSSFLEYVSWRRVSDEGNVVPRLVGRIAGALRLETEPMSSPEYAFLLVSTKNTDSGHFQFMRSRSVGPFL